MAFGLLLVACIFTPAAVSSTIDCSFEDANICGYQQSHDDQLDWTRHSGTTTTLDTGPYNDHTLGNTQGYYMYIESSTPARPGDTATLTSPTLTPTSPLTCLTFWYSMYGVGTGTLTVLLASGSDVIPVWSLTGNQGSSWRKAHVVIGISDPIKVIFQGTLSSSSSFYYGDMAIDDVIATAGECDGLDIPSPTLSTTLQRTTTRYAGTSPANCNFEQGHLCGYQQLPSVGTPRDDLDWTLHQGPTPTSGSGPNTDHTLGNILGHYIYVNGSSPNHHATLISPNVLMQSPSCLTFWYSMDGATMGQLTVLTATPHLLNLHAVWHVSGNQGPGWKMAKIDILDRYSNYYQIIFNGVTGHGHLSDIAIDDIVLWHETCEEKSTTTTQTPTATTTHYTTTTTGSTTTHIETSFTYTPSLCQECEGLECFTQAQTVRCSPEQPLCSSSVRDSASGSRTAKKGCISLPECNQWIPTDSEHLQCLSVEQQVTGHDLDCLFCCHGDLCNKGPSYIPKTDSWVGENQHKILIG